MRNTWHVGLDADGTRGAGTAVGPVSVLCRIASFRSGIMYVVSQPLVACIGDSICFSSIDICCIFYVVTRTWEQGGSVNVCVALATPANLDILVARPFQSPLSHQSGKKTPMEIHLVPSHHIPSDQITAISVTDDVLR